MFCIHLLPAGGKKFRNAEDVHAYIRINYFACRFEYRLNDDDDAGCDDDDNDGNHDGDDVDVNDDNLDIILYYIIYDEQIYSKSFSLPAQISTSASSQS